MYHKPKKSLGQNFLIDKNLQNKIVDSCGLKKSDIVLEIGPGRAEITKLLIDRVEKVFAVELDKNLHDLLKDTVKSSNFEVVNEDILKFDFENFFAKINRKIKVIANIPYYITTPIIEKLLEHKSNIEDIYLTVQKEFAMRVVAIPGSKIYGSLSCFLQYFTEPEILFFISRGCFKPVPKVDSCLLRIRIRDVPQVKVQDEEKFFKIIRSSFNQRRKILRNSLSEIVEEAKLDEFFNKYNINKSIRPERLSLADFANLANLSEDITYGASKNERT